MSTREYATIWICTDCIMALAGDGDWSHLDPDRARGSIISADEVVLGIGLNEHSCVDDGDRENLPECECEVWAFSTTSCPMCGETLAGERHGATVFYAED